MNLSPSLHKDIRHKLYSIHKPNLKPLLFSAQPAKQAQLCEWVGPDVCIGLSGCFNIQRKKMLDILNTIIYFPLLTFYECINNLQTGWEPLAGHMWPMSHQLTITETIVTIIPNALFRCILYQIYGTLWNLLHIVGRCDTSCKIMTFDSSSFSQRTSQKGKCLWFPMCPLLAGDDCPVCLSWLLSLVFNPTRHFSKAILCLNLEPHWAPKFWSRAPPAVRWRSDVAPV